MRLIDADALAALFSERGRKYREEYSYSKAREADAAQCIVRQAPTIDAEPVRHGRWDENTVPFCNVCQECGAVVERNCVKRNGSLKRCPNCGTKMDKEKTT